MYSKPSFQDNLFDGLEVDYTEYEVSVKCPKKNRSITRHNYSSNRRTTTTKNYYIIKRPMRGHLKLKIFCYFCEKYYHLKVHSESKLKRKRKIYNTIFILLALSFWYFPIKLFRYVVWIYLFAKIFENNKHKFVEASARHKARIVRKWKPTKVEHNYSKSRFRIS